MYDPNAPVPYWHQNMEMATVCITNGLSLIIMVARTWYRRKTMGRFRADDKWIIAAAVLLVFPYFVSQLGTLVYGSGLHTANVPDSWIIPHWAFSSGWVGYYLVCACVKISTCCCLLQVLPYPFVTLRRWVYVFCALIMSLAIVETCIWEFQCQPIKSNFDYFMNQSWCIDIDYVRYLWEGISIPIDIVIVAIPCQILRKTRLQRHEKKVLMLVFAANLLGTLACGATAYGIWRNRDSITDISYSETTFVMTSDIEILMYTVGAAFPVLSRHFISRASPAPTRASASYMPSWRRRVSNTIASPTSENRHSQWYKRRYPSLQSLDLETQVNFSRDETVQGDYMEMSSSKEKVTDGVRRVSDEESQIGEPQAAVL